MHHDVYEIKENRYKLGANVPSNSSICFYYDERWYYFFFVFVQCLCVPSWPWSHGSWIYNYLCNRYLSPPMLWVQIPIRSRCTTLCDKVCRWIATGRWFSPSPTVSSTNKTDRHDLTEILLIVALSTIKLNQANLCVPNVTCVPGLSIIYYAFRFL